MIPITWLSCLTVLWTIIVDIQADQVDPLVLAVYSPKYDERRLAFLDLADVNDENLQLPLDAATPQYFVLFCGTDEIREHHFIGLHLFAQLVTKEIDSEARNLKCEHHPSPRLIIYSSTSISVLAYTGYLIHTEKSLKQGNENNASNELFNTFRNEFKFNSWRDDYFVKYLEDIKYDHIHNVPLFIAHTVKAHMHSNTYKRECEKINFNTYTLKSKEYRLDTLHNIHINDFKWRQLVPMQDFMGKYAIEATCIYFNYLLLHEKAIESLKNIEIFIRDVADRLNEIHVESGTYTPEKEVSLKGNVQNQTIIASIVWKKITYRDGWPDYYTILAVIHNRKTKRICEHINDIEKLGFPKYDDEKNITDNEIDIGGMYYCLVDNRINGLLKISGNEFEKPLNLNNLPSTKDDVDPFVMAVYSPKYEKKRISFVHLTNMNDENWKLPLDAAEPEYFVLLCGSGKIEGDNYKYSRLIVQRITKQIDSEARNLKCKHHSLPNFSGRDINGNFSFVNIKYDLNTESWKQKDLKIESSELLTKFQNDFPNEYNYDNSIGFLNIRYHRKYHIPALIEHTVKVHMHSNIDGKDCKEIRLTIINNDYEEPLSNTLYDIKVPDYQWRQLVPMQDFRDINVANATCTNLNFLLLHKDAIESLINIENFIRDIADVINEVSVETGTYTPEEKVLLQGDEPNQTMIPSIVWKKITHQSSSTDYYTVLVVIHNRKTERICSNFQNQVGWPEYNTKNEDDIGYMYYCFFEKDTWNLLGFRTDNIEETHEDEYKNEKIRLERFDLNHLPYVKGDRIKTVDVLSKIEKSKQDTSNSIVNKIFHPVKWLFSK